LREKRFWSTPRKKEADRLAAGAERAEREVLEIVASKI